MENAGTVRIVRFDVAHRAQFNENRGICGQQRRTKARTKAAPYTNSLKTGTSGGNKATTAVDAKCAILN